MNSIVTYGDAVEVYKTDSNDLIVVSKPTWGALKLKNFMGSTQKQLPLAL